MNLDELCRRYNAGDKFKYVFFWGHQPARNGVVTASCFSQWFPSPFTENGVTYPTAEHYMMAGKARLFGDLASCEKIIASSDPKKVKALGRGVAGFNEAVWCEHRFQIVQQACLLKFSQNNAMGEFLVGTGKRVIVEASPVDKIWGIGMAGVDDGVENPNRWRGLNLLGFALMVAREKLREKL